MSINRHKNFYISYLLNEKGFYYFAILFVRYLYNSIHELVNSFKSFDASKVYDWVQKVIFLQKVITL